MIKSGGIVAHGSRSGFADSLVVFFAVPFVPAGQGDFDFSLPVFFLEEDCDVLDFPLAGFATTPPVNATYAKRHADNLRKEKAMKKDSVLGRSICINPHSLTSAVFNKSSFLDSP